MQTVAESTGSFENIALKPFMTTDIGQLRIFSRDEKKQDDIRHELQMKYPERANKIKFYTCDVRGYRSITDTTDYVQKQLEIDN